VRIYGIRHWIGPGTCSLVASRTSRSAVATTNGVTADGSAIGDLPLSASNDDQHRCQVRSV
jgi:hypothetical protein